MPLPEESLPGGPGALGPPPDPPLAPLLASWEPPEEAPPAAASKEAAAGTTADGEPPDGDPADGVNTPGGTADMEELLLEPVPLPELEFPPELDM